LNFPQAVQSGDQLAAFKGKGYDGTGFSNPVGMVTVNAFDNWTTGNVPSQLRFYTTGYNDGSNPILNMTVSPTGNVDIINGNLIVSGGGGYLQGNTVTGNDGLYAGSANFTPLGSNVVAQFGANSNSYSQINFQNINNGELASADYVLTANNGDDSTYFVDLGITGNNHSDGAFFGDTSTANDAYLYVVGPDATGPGGSGPGNLILGSTNGTIKMFVGNTAQANVIATVDSSVLVINTGNLTLPLGGVVSEGASPSGLGNTIALTPAGGSDADQQLLVYPTGNVIEGNHLHLTTGNLYNTELYLGNDNLYVKLANTGNVVINSYDGIGNAGQWTFGTDGNLTTPGAMIINGNINTLGSQTALLQSTDDLPLSFIASGANGTVTSFWAEDFGNLMASNIAAIYTPLQGTQTVRIVTGTNGGNIAIYDFDKNGVFSTAQVSATGNITGNYFVGNGSQLTGTVSWVTAPVANTSPGTAGQAAYDVGGNLYICVTANTWSKFTGTTSW
jgi:hypothetical protein